jgi:hypothetical protein
MTSNPLFKLMMMYNNEGEFIDTVYPPCSYGRAQALLKSYRQKWGNTHTYILVEVMEPAMDTPLAEVYGG